MRRGILAAAQLGGNIGGELFLYVDDNPDSHQNLIITFWPIYNGPWNLHANSLRDICIKSTNQQAKVCENN